MKRRDFLAEAISEKSFTEDLMKSFGWATLCGAVLSMSTVSLKAGDFISGLLIFGVFIVLSTLAMMYVALHIVIPLDSAMYPNDPYWDEKSYELKGISKLIEAAKIFLTRKGIVYLILSMGYALYAIEVSQYIASKVSA